MSDRRLGRLLKNGLRNAALCWSLLILVLTSGIKFLLLGWYTWAFMSFSMFVITVLPVVFRKDMKSLVPWEILFIAVFPVVSRLFITDFNVSSFVGYSAVAALSLIIGVELQMFTEVRMTDGFASFFVFVMTLATAGFWALVRWSSDLLFGTVFITELYYLMVEMVVAALSGIAAGVFFNLYFRYYMGSKRFSRRDDHV